MGLDQFLGSHFVMHNDCVRIHRTFFSLSQRVRSGSRTNKSTDRFNFDDPVGTAQTFRCVRRG